VVAHLIDAYRGASHIIVPMLCRFGTLIAGRVKGRTEAAHAPATGSV